MTLNVTAMERELLEALAARPDRALTPAQLIHDMPAQFGRRTPQGLHQTAASLARKGLVYRENAGSGIGYQIKAHVLPKLAAAENDRLEQRRCAADAELHRQNLAVDEFEAQFWAARPPEK